MPKFTIDDITPGLKFEQKGGFVWQVARVIRFPGELVAHVQLQNVRDPSTTKTLSSEVLFDKSRFRVVQEA